MPQNIMNIVVAKLANRKLELKNCIPEMVTTFLVLFNTASYKKAPFYKRSAGSS